MPDAQSAEARIVSHLERLSHLEASLAAFRDVAVRLEAGLQRVEEKVDQLRTERRVDPEQHEKLEGRVRLLEIAVLGGGAYIGRQLLAQL